MNFPTILSLLLIIPLSNSCLVINSPITTTPPVKCSCPYLKLDSSNLQQFAGNSPIYRNITSYHITTPSMSSTDNCSLTVECSADYSLVVFDTEDYAFFGNRELPGFCDPYTQKWTLDDGIGELRTFSRIYATCYKEEEICNCTSISITPTTVGNLTITSSNGPNCQKVLKCSIGNLFTYPVYTGDLRDASYFELSNPNATLTMNCDPRTSKWMIADTIYNISAMECIDRPPPPRPIPLRF